MNTEKITSNDPLYSLFKHMADEHECILLHDQLCDIVAICRKIVPIPADIKSRIEAEYPHEGVPSCLPVTKSKSNNRIDELRQVAERYYSIGRSEAGNVDWDKMERDYAFTWKDADTFQWFKSRLQGVKVEDKKPNYFAGDKVQLANPEALLKAYRVVFDKPAPAEHGEVMSADFEKHLTDRITYLFKAEMSSINELDNLISGPLRDVKWKLINELAARRHELENTKKQYVLSCRGNEAVEQSIAFAKWLKDCTEYQEPTLFLMRIEKDGYELPAMPITYEEAHKIFKNKEI